MPPSRPSHEGRGLKLITPTLAALVDGRPSHEGRGLKLLRRPRQACLEGRPSHEGRGLKHPVVRVGGCQPLVALLMKGVG